MIVYGELQVWMARPPHLWGGKKPWHFLQQPCPARGERGKTAHGNGQAADYDPRNNSNNDSRNRCVKVKTQYVSWRFSRGHTQPNSTFKSSRGFFRPLSPPAHSATFGRIKAQLLRFFFFLHDARFYFFKCSRSISEACTSVYTRKHMQDEKIYLDSRLQILSCEWSYNKKGWCSFCLPLVGPPLPGRFVHFWVPLWRFVTARTYIHTVLREAGCVCARVWLSLSVCFLLSVHVAAA